MYRKYLRYEAMTQCNAAPRLNLTNFQFSADFNFLRSLTGQNTSVICTIYRIEKVLFIHTFPNNNLRQHFFNIYPFFNQCTSCLEITSWVRAPVDVVALPYSQPLKLAWSKDLESSADLKRYLCAEVIVEHFHMRSKIP